MEQKMKPKVLYFDEQLYENSLAFLERTSKQWNEIAQIWKDQKILPELNRERFERLLSSPEYIQVAFEESVRAKLDNLADGIGAMFNAQSVRLNLPENFSNIIYFARSSPPSRVRCIEDYNLIGFQAGFAIISDEAKATLKDRCSLPDTPENRRKMQTIQGYCDAHNNFASLLGEIFKISIHPKGDYLESKLFEYTTSNQIAPKFGTLLTL
jgi:hypothetical protein